MNVTRICLLFLSFLFSSSLSLFAQSKADKKIGKQLGKTFCTCMGKDLKGMNKHAEKDLIALLENPTGAESYMASLGEKRKEKLESELFRLEKLGENIEGCLDESDMVELLEGSDNVEGIMNLAVAAMGKKKSCKLPYLIFKLGLSIEEEEQ